MIALHEIIRQYPKELQHPGFYDHLVKEYFHHQMLKVLFRNKLAGQIAFIGGTSLRYFYGLKRFSEDIDLDCFDLSRADFFSLTNSLLRELVALGFNVETEDKKRYAELSAFRRVYVFPELKFNMGLSQHREAKFFIKVEAESQKFDYEPEIKTINNFGVTCPVRIMPLNILFSSKIAALLNRKKDRDFYDVVYLINFARPDFNFLDKKCGVNSPSQLKDAMLEAATVRKLKTRKIYDCEHMLFSKSSVELIRSFSDYIEHFDFEKLTR